ERHRIPGRWCACPGPASARMRRAFLAWSSLVKRAAGTGTGECGNSRQRTPRCGVEWRASQHRGVECGADHRCVTGLADAEARGQSADAGQETVQYFWRSEEHTSELQSLRHLVCRLLLEKK